MFQIKINKALEDGDYYEAFQLYRSWAQRMAGKNESLGALDLLADGILKFIRLEREDLYSELCVVVEKVISKWKQEYEEPIIRLINELPVHDNEFPASVEKWVRNLRPSSSELQAAIGNKYLSMGKYHGAVACFIMSKRPDLFIRTKDVVLDIFSGGRTEDAIDVCIHAILCLLMQEEHQKAYWLVCKFLASVFSTNMYPEVERMEVSCKYESEKISLDFFKTNLHQLNFLQLVVFTFQRNNANMLRVLDNAYKSHLSIQNRSLMVKLIDAYHCKERASGGSNHVRTADVNLSSIVRQVFGPTDFQLPPD